MVWKIKLNPKVEKDLKKLDKTIQKKILAYLKEKIALQQNPRLFGKGLQGDKQGLWRYRVGDYRVICKILDDELVILVIKTAHRKNVYLD